MSHANSGQSTMGTPPMDMAGLGEAIGQEMVIALSGDQPNLQRATHVSKLVKKYLVLRDPKVFLAKCEQV